LPARCLHRAPNVLQFDRKLDTELIEKRTFVCLY
jgi:hypothetical protein